MSVKWTAEQQKVIDTRNKNILVSAAAGSGKTAVLVARILAMVTDPVHPVDIDRLLVVTFTNAAAAEMRQRIRDALEMRAEEEPENEHLQRQLVLIHNAKITTIHSFCLQVLRSHFHTVGIDPAFRVADEGEMLLLKQDVLKETLEEAYAKNGSGFHTFLEQFAPGKDDRAVGDAVLALYHFSLGQPWPGEWLAKCREVYGAEEDAEAASQQQEAKRWGTQKAPAWITYAAEDTHRILEDVLAQLQEALRIAEEPDGPYPYSKALLDDIAMVEEIRLAQDYDALAEAFAKAGAYTRLSTKKDEAISEEKKLLVQEMRARVKEDLASVRGQYFYDRPEVLREEFRKSGVIVRELTYLAEQFAERLAEKKAEKNFLDFSDLEHLALQVLVEKKDGEIVPTAAAREYAEQFEEIMIDEYQDSNLVQEILLNGVSGKGRQEPNLFMVGDVKQSIYRFRLARPELFLEKYRTYQADGEKACRIDLHKNFRSRAQVLDSVNQIFRQIMTENPGGIVYDKDAALYAGAQFEEREGEEELTTEVLLLEADGSRKKEAEARMVGAKIRELAGTAQVWDAKEEAYRPAQYRDIVILLRTVSGWADTFGEELTAMGIPCFTGSQKGYFSAAEVRVVLSYLQVLDNPVQDIPLAAVLRSPIGNLTDEELAKIRSASEERSFYDCCQAYRREGAEEDLRGKLERFFAMTDLLRKKAEYTPVHLLLWEILDVTGYGEYAAALPAGSQRRANLDMLVEKAIAYEATSYRGLYHFVRYIENLKNYEVDYGEANIGTEADNTVRIMSIHKSKGLEFPIVFVCGMGKQFNESDVRARVVLHPELGIGCDYVDTEQRLRQPNLLKKVIQKVSMSENLGEELRVLYVAMTRAKEKLILTGSAADTEKQMAAWSGIRLTPQGTLPYARLISASSYLDWVMPPVLHDLDEEQNFYSFQLLHAEDLILEEAGSAADHAARLEELLNRDLESVYAPEARAYLETVFQAVYPYEAEREIAGKLSVSELKKRSQIPEETEGEELYQPETVVPLIPEFREESETIRGAARGTLYHAFLESFDFRRKEEVEIQLEERVTCGKMTQEEADAIYRRDIRRFLASGIGKRMERAALAGTLHREQPFVIGVPADRIQSGWSSRETVLVQGIIDAWFVEEDGEAVVLDYKTDRVENGAELAERYRIQLDYYAEAIGRLTGYRVKEKLLYSFYLGEEIRVE